MFASVQHALSFRAKRPRSLSVGLASLIFALLTVQFVILSAAEDPGFTLQAASQTTLS